MSGQGPVMLFRNASLILGMINVLQPVSEEVLLRELGEDRRVDLTDSLSFLQSKKYVRSLPGRSYRTTWEGQRALWSKVLSRSRDIQRMWYLSDLSDRYRNGGEGEAS